MYSEEIAEEKSIILSKKWYKKKFNKARADNHFDRRKIKENYPKDFMLDIEELRRNIIGNSKEE